MSPKASGSDPSFAILRPRESSRESWSISAPQRERANVRAPTGVPATILSLGVTARELRSGFSPSPQRSSPRSRVPGNGESPERFFSPLSLLQLQCRGSVSKAWVPEPPPWQRSANCRAADHLQRRSERVCVCVRVRRKEGHLFACACVCVHSCVSERCLGWRRTGSTFTSASRPRTRGHGGSGAPRPVPEGLPPRLPRRAVRP